MGVSILRGTVPQNRWFIMQDRWFIMYMIVHDKLIVDMVVLWVYYYICIYGGVLK